MEVEVENMDPLLPFLADLIGHDRAPESGTLRRLIREGETTLAAWRQAAYAVESAAKRVSAAANRFASKETTDAG